MVIFNGLITSNDKDYFNVAIIYRQQTSWFLVINQNNVFKQCIWKYYFYKSILMVRNKVKLKTGDNSYQAKHVMPRFRHFVTLQEIFSHYTVCSTSHICFGILHTNSIRWQNKKCSCINHTHRCISKARQFQMFTILLLMFTVVLVLKRRVHLNKSFPRSS